jgi:hypothetical protein
MAVFSVGKSGDWLTSEGSLGKGLQLLTVLTVLLVAME